VEQLARLSIDEECGLLRACLHGEVDMTNVAVVRAQLDELTSSRLVLDLSGLEFFDSSGIRMVLQLWRQRVAAGQFLQLLVTPDSPIRRVLTVAEVDRIMPIHLSWDEAAAHAAGTSPAR